MKKLIGMFILGLMVTLSACGGGGLGASVDLSGTWQGNMTIQGATVPLSFELNDDGSLVSGSFSQSYASYNFSVNSRVSGNTITITASATTQSVSYTMSFTATVNGDTMSGNISYTIDTDFGPGRTINGSFTLTRS